MKAHFATRAFPRLPRAYARMTAAAIDHLAKPDDPKRCPTELSDYIAAAVARSEEPAEA